MIKNKKTKQVEELMSKIKYDNNDSYLKNISNEKLKFDVEHILSLIDGERLAINLDIKETYHKLDIYSKDFMPLYKSLPIFNNFGLNLISQEVYEIEIDGIKYFIQHIKISSQSAILSENKHNLVEGLLEVLSGNAKNDYFNQLCLEIGLNLFQINIMRVQTAYLFQLGVSPGNILVVKTLLKYPDLTKALVGYFSTKFGTKKLITNENEEDIINSILIQFEKVESLYDDKLLRTFVYLNKYIVRTNFFINKNEIKSGKSQGLDYGKPFSFKVFFTALKEFVEGVTMPAPMFETFVYSPDFQGIHLRFDKVARGGIRWSNRKDFRNEVLDLARTQNIKNITIVPAGGKGSFLLNEESDIDGVSAYKLFISSLLELVDNIELKGKKTDVISDKNILIYDDYDPYFVVAADKGTATFSDIANSIANERNFWLDDAFASGGSNGYDHKKMGITAKGAWESVKRNFRFLGKNIENEEFTAIGVGDMSGDVFGNGMILSNKTKLIAAFNHKHIFVDPNPDAEKSYAERLRLFKLERSNWADYDKSLISKGGGVFERNVKHIKISKQLQEALDMDISLVAQKISPDALIKEILRAKIEMIFFGGIGTYIKNATDSDQIIGDRANDSIRVLANEVRAKIIGEGANLGMTQTARVNFNLAGGLCYGDFIDNAAGVTCSDHEVNIKILLSQMIQKQGLDLEQRNTLLKKMTNSVTDLVLSYNKDQTLAISLSSLFKNSRIDRHLNLIDNLELHQVMLESNLKTLKNSVLCLTSIGLITAYVKNDFVKNLQGIKYLEINKDDELHNFNIDTYKEILVSYFPKELHDKKELIYQHQLSNEIISTALSNKIINQAGLTFINELQNKKGYDLKSLVDSYLLINKLLKIDEIWSTLNSLDDKLNVHQQYIAFDICKLTIIRSIFWLDEVEMNFFKSKKDFFSYLETALNFVVDNYQNIFDNNFLRINSNFLEETMVRTQVGKVAKDLSTQETKKARINFKKYVKADLKKSLEVFQRIGFLLDVTKVILHLEKVFQIKIITSKVKKIDFIKNYQQISEVLDSSFWFTWSEKIQTHNTWQRQLIFNFRNDFRDLNNKLIIYLLQSGQLDMEKFKTLKDIFTKHKKILDNNYLLEKLLVSFNSLEIDLDKKIFTATSA